MCLVKTALSLFPAQSMGQPASVQDKMKSHEAYMRNREARKRSSKMWKLEHRAQVRRYAKRYKRQVNAGARIPKMRAGSGAGGYQLLGTKPTNTIQASLQANVVPQRINRI